MAFSNDEDREDGGTLASLTDLVASPGWALLVAWAKGQYGPEGYGRQMQAALSGVPQGPDRPYEVARIAEQIDATARAVNEVMHWPEMQIKQLSPEARSRRPFAGLRRT